MTEDSEEQGAGDEDDRSMSRKIDDMEERIDDHDEDISELRRDLEDHLDMLDSRIRRIESGAVRAESAHELYNYIVEVEAEMTTLRDRLETAIGEDGPDNTEGSE